MQNEGQACASFIGAAKSICSYMPLRANVMLRPLHLAALVPDRKYWRLTHAIAQWYVSGQG
jgi:hypothetical protein